MMFKIDFPDFDKEVGMHFYLSLLFKNYSLMVLESVQFIFNIYWNNHVVYSLPTYMDPHSR